MDKLARKVDIHHAAMQGSYFAGFSAIWGFGPVLLLYLGLSNSTLGVVTSLALVLPLLLQPALAALSDADSRWTSRRLALVLSLLTLAAAVVMTVSTGSKTVLVAAYGVGCAMGGLLQDAHGPRFAGLWGTALLAGGFFAASMVPVANAVLFLLVYSLPAGLGSAFLAPAVLACAQKWYKDKKGWATGVAGVAMGLSGAFFTLFVKGVGGAWGIRVCFAALGAVMLVICGAGALILQDPPAPATSGNPQPGLDWPRMVRTTQYKLCVAAVALSAPAVLLFSPEIFKIATERGLPEAAAPCSIVLGSAASAAGRLLLPACSDKLGRKPVLYAVYLGLAAGSVWFAFAAEWWVLAAYAVLTFFYSGGAAVQPAFNTDLFGLPHAGVNYGFIALGMSGGSLVSYIGSQALPLAARHWLAGACAVAGLVCVRLVKPCQIS